MVHYTLENGQCCKKKNTHKHTSMIFKMSGQNYSPLIMLTQ